MTPSAAPGGGDVGEQPSQTDLTGRRKPGQITYVITVSRRHLLPAQMCIHTLRQKSEAPIVVIGNLTRDEAASLQSPRVDYIDERDIDVSGRMPSFAWSEKYREVGWYKQMFYRLSVDRFVESAQAVILDSEVFVFDNWDETRLYDPVSGHPRCFFWIPTDRKPDLDYRLYCGAAYLLRTLPGFENVQEYASGDAFRRHISGVVLFSTANVAELWRRLESETDLAHNLGQLFNHEEGLAFSDHDLYGIAADYGIFEDIVPTVLHNNLLGWYDNHDDPKFALFRQGAMWSMCQRYFDYPTAADYRDFMESTAQALGTRLPGGRAPQVRAPAATLVTDSSGTSRMAATEGEAQRVGGPWVLVLGMHRAGTSAMTGALAELGMTLPPGPDLIRGMPDNPVHYESRALITVNDRILAALGSPWNAPVEPAVGWESEQPVVDFDDTARSTLSRIFPGPGPNVWKDPRNCILLPYWRRLLAEPVVAVFIWRSPLAVATSLQNRDGLSLAHGLALWEHHNRHALEALAGMPVYVISNQALLDDPFGACTAIASWLDEVGISAGGSGRWEVEKAGDVIVPSLSHHRTDDVSDLSPAQLDLVERLRSLEGAHPELERVEMGPVSPWAVAMLDTERRLIHTSARLMTLARGNQDLSDAHNQLIITHSQLAKVSDERLEHIEKLQEVADQRLELVEQLERDAASLGERIAALQLQCDQLAVDRAEWQRRARQADETLGELSSSISWRVTAPLRVIRSLVHGEKENPSQ